MATFGNTIIGPSTTTLNANRISGGLFTLEERGIINKIFLYVSAVWTSGEKLKCAIYDSDKNFITDTEELDTGGSGWIEFNIKNRVVIEDGNYYICCWSDNNLNVKTDTTGASVNPNDNEVYTASFPDPLVTTNSNSQYSIYCEYTPKLKGTKSTAPIATIIARQDIGQVLSNVPEGLNGVISTVLSKNRVLLELN